MNDKLNILNELAACGCQPANEGDINFNIHGAFSRYQVIGDKPGSKNGWLFIKLDYLNVKNIKPIVWAAFGSWKTGSKHYWSSIEPTNLCEDERDSLCKKIIDSGNVFRKEQRIRYESVSIEVNRLWSRYSSANPDHKYLQVKQINPFCARQYKGNLVLPIVDIHEKIWSLQSISPTSDKYLHKGGKKKGNFIPVQDSINNKQIYICEGFSTAATIAMYYPNTCVVAAIDAGNLKSVAINIRSFNKAADITICGDDDRLSKGNPGATKAREAAEVSGGRVVLPQFPADAPKELTDFNDLHCWNLRNGTKQLQGLL